MGAARVLIQVAEGLRQGETLGLGWSGVDLVAGRVRIAQTLSRPAYPHGLRCADRDSHSAGRRDSG